MHDYIPERDDYLNWKDDWNKIPEWDDGTHSVVKKNDEKIWLKDGKIHRDDDKPAKIKFDEISWYKNNADYRENDKPAKIHIFGQREWHNGYGLYSREYHRPAIIYPNGNKKWYFQGKQYFPTQSIIKSIIFDPKLGLIKNYLNSFQEKDRYKILVPEIQKLIFEKYYSEALSLIPRELLIPEYEGFGTLQNIGLWLIEL